MKYALWLLTAVVLAGLTGCPENGATVQTNSPGAVSSDDEFTIRLMVVATTDHVQRAQSYKDHTERETRWKDVYVLVKENYSELYLGKYPTRKAAEKNLKAALAYKTSAGIQAFPRASVQMLPGKDVGPPEWNLTNTKGVYTVLVASFTDPDNKVATRKELAVAACKYFREQEHEEAYYYHTNVQSIVTIGSFDASAIKEVKEPTGATSTFVNEPKINAIIARHPFLAVNGKHIQVLVPDLQTKKGVWLDKRSYVIKIPREAANSLINPTVGAPLTLPSNP